MAAGSSADASPNLVRRALSKSVSALTYPSWHWHVRMPPSRAAALLSSACLKARTCECRCMSGYQDSLALHGLRLTGGEVPAEHNCCVIQSAAGVVVQDFPFAAALDDGVDGALPVPAGSHVRGLERCLPEYDAALWQKVERCTSRCSCEEIFLCFKPHAVRQCAISKMHTRKAVLETTSLRAVRGTLDIQIFRVVIAARPLAAAISLCAHRQARTAGEREAGCFQVPSHALAGIGKFWVLFLVPP